MRTIVGTGGCGFNEATTPYVGLPQSTVDLIAADKALTIVDWVRVTR